MPGSLSADRGIDMALLAVVAVVLAIAGHWVWGLVVLIGGACLAAVLD